MDPRTSHAEKTRFFRSLMGLGVDFGYLGSPLGAPLGTLWPLPGRAGTSQDATEILPRRLLGAVGCYTASRDGPRNNFGSIVDAPDLFQDRFWNDFFVDLRVDLVTEPPDEPMRKSGEGGENWGGRHEP